MSIRTFAVFPDSKFKYGGIAYIGSPDMNAVEMRKFVLENSFAKLAKNLKLRKCFDYANFLTTVQYGNGRKVYVAAYRFYPPFLWSRKRIEKTLKESFDECFIEPTPTKKSGREAD